MSPKLRNIAIIAHVDHGKTTLVDGLLKQTDTFGDHASELTQDLIMDSGDQEKERGITITAKITAVKYKDTHINIIDTPGHADFSGEVERTLHMADGCLLIVDAQEGPMPQTKFVLKKAMQANLRPIVVINKIDKPAARIDAVEDELADLFLELATDDAQLHYPVFYAIAREGKAWESVPDDASAPADLSVLFEAIVEHVPTPPVAEGEGLQIMTTALDWDSYKGKYAIGRVERGEITKGQSLLALTPEGDKKQYKVDSLFIVEGLRRVEVDSASQGQIVAITGLPDVKIGQTICDIDHPDPLPILSIEKPTLSMYLGPNTSPFKGTEGQYTTSRQIADRLHKELETNIGLEVEDVGTGFTIRGRGELHISVLLEAMRREGFEFEVGQPQVVTIKEDGITKEPYEEVTVEVPLDYAGSVTTEFNKRRATQLDQHQIDDSTTRMIFEMPTRALLGLRSLLITATRGTIIMNSITLDYREKQADLQKQRSGALLAFEKGKTTPYALQSAEARGTLLVGSGVEVYAGQIIGINTRSDDLEINVVKEKHLTNMRASGSDGTVQLTPPTLFSLEQCIDFLEDDELLAVTPKSLRLRKRELDKNKRKKSNK